MARGKLRIYLGAAPGVGKTFAMLNEGKRRRARGTDVVVGLVETHGRANTAAEIGDLEVVPRRRIGYRGTDFEEMDVDAVLARKPQVALIDEIAHTNVPGSRNEKRWQDVAEVLDAGIDVISTLNMQHLESVNDVVERITGVKQHETIPDAIVRAAEQVELVDMTPEALRRRMAHGNIYPPDRIDASLGNYFRPGNLAALRELALLWVADKVDESLQGYMDEHGIRGPWETRERVVVAITGAPGGDGLIRRAARMAMRAHAELLGVHVRSTDGLGVPGVLLLYLLAVVASAATGGVLPALAASIAAFVLANWYFIAPLHEWTIHEGKDFIALFAFLLVAGVVSALVNAAARRSAEAARARAEAETLARLGAQLMTEEDPLPLLISTLRTT